VGKFSAHIGCNAYEKCGISRGFATFHLEEFFPVHFYRAVTDEFFCFFSWTYESSELSPKSAISFVNPI